MLFHFDKHITIILVAQWLPDLTAVSMQSDRHVLTSLYSRGFRVIVDKYFSKLCYKASSTLYTEDICLVALASSLQYIDTDSVLTSYHISSTARSDMRLYMPQINHITLRLPAAPPLSQPTDVNPSMYCNSTAMNDCNDEFCYCTHMLNVKRGSLVEVILVDEGMYWGI